MCVIVATASHSKQCILHREAKTELPPILRDNFDLIKPQGECMPFTARIGDSLSIGVGIDLYSEIIDGRPVLANVCVCRDGWYALPEAGKSVIATSLIYM